MIPLSLKHVINTGDWSPFRLGMTREEAVAACGEPDATGYPNKQGLDEVWKYGDVEVIFMEGRVDLLNIHAFYGEVPTGGSRLALDPWVIRKGLGLAEFLTAIESISVPYHLSTPKYDDRQRHVMLRERPRFYAVFAEWEERSRPADDSRVGFDGLWLSDGEGPDR